MPTNEKMSLTEERDKLMEALRFLSPEGLSEARKTIVKIGPVHTATWDSLVARKGELEKALLAKEEELKAVRARVRELEEENRELRKEVSERAGFSGEAING